LDDLTGCADAVTAAISLHFERIAALLEIVCENESSGRFRGRKSIPSRRGL
jgi:hypothetical protein